MKAWLKASLALLVAAAVVLPFAAVRVGPSPEVSSGAARGVEERVPRPISSDPSLAHHPSLSRPRAEPAKHEVLGAHEPLPHVEAISIASDPSFSVHLEYHPGRCQGSLRVSPHTCRPTGLVGVNPALQVFLRQSRQPYVYDFTLSGPSELLWLRPSPAIEDPTSCATEFLFTIHRTGEHVLRGWAFPSAFPDDPKAS
eukprot:RCo008212